MSEKPRSNNTESNSKLTKTAALIGLTFASFVTTNQLNDRVLETTDELRAAKTEAQREELEAEAYAENTMLALGITFSLSSLACTGLYLVRGRLRQSTPRLLTDSETAE